MIVTKKQYDKGLETAKRNLVAAFSQFTKKERKRKILVIALKLGTSYKMVDIYANGNGNVYRRYLEILEALGKC